MTVFVFSLLFSLAAFYILSHYSDYAWSATARVYHRKISDKTPVFYAPMTLDTITKIFALGDVSRKVVSELRSTEKDFSPRLLSNVSISTERKASEIITINAKAPSPRCAAAIANAVADFGIAEYVSRQNESIQTLISERTLQKKKALDELSLINIKMLGFLKGEVTDYPPDAIAQRKAELVQARNEYAALKAKIADSEVKIAEMEKQLSETPKDVEFEVTMDHTARISLEGKQSMLKQLRKRYTDQNPKIITLLDEIKELQEQNKNAQKNSSPSKITYRKNLVYNEIESRLMQIRVDKKSYAELLKECDGKIKSLRERLAFLHEKLPEFEELKRTQNILESKLASINQSLQNLDVMYISTIPDLAILNRAVPPSDPSYKGFIAKSVAFSIFLDILYIFYVCAAKILRLTILSYNDFKNFGIYSIGEIPEATASAAEKTSAIMRCYSVLRKIRKGRRIFLYVKYSDDTESDSLLLDFMRLNKFNNLKSAIIKCKHTDIKEPEFCEGGTVLKKDEVFPNTLTFEYANNMYINEKCLNTLACELKSLKNDYEVIVLSMRCDKNFFLVAQLAKLCDFVLFIACFDLTKKNDVSIPVKMTKHMVSKDVGFGGILTQVPKYYYYTKII
ncbi:MAG: hypothetical protein SPF41_03620 [Candidatus Merdousia sp.]|nr:hypothetical protein [Candidatus Merdousia sp.]